MFDKVSSHLLTQMKKSWVAGIGCMHRGPNGLMCAIGCLITDEQYTIDLEKVGISLAFYGHTPLERILRDQGISNDNLLTRLQIIHDSTEISNWRDRLMELAANFNLKGDICTISP